MIGCDKLANRGKEFEKIFKKSVEELDDLYCLRLYDTTNGFAEISNPCDYIVYRNKVLYLCELKSTQGNTLNFKSMIRENQWEGLLKASNIKGVIGYIICWYVDRQVTKAYNIIELEKLKQAGNKSVRFDDNNGITVPCKVKRVYCDYDFSDIF